MNPEKEKMKPQVFALVYARDLLQVQDAIQVGEVTSDFARAGVQAPTHWHTQRGKTWNPERENMKPVERHKNMQISMGFRGGVHVQKCISYVA